MSGQENNAAIVNPEKYKWRAGFGAVAGYTFDGVDFMVLSLAIPFLMKAWGISMAEAGAIATATLFGNAIAGYIFGPLADKIGRKKSLVICIFFYGITTAMCGFAQSYVQLMVIRFISGLGLGAQWALSATLLAEFFPPTQRGKASSAMQAGWPIGYAIAVGFQIWLVPVYGWRALFFAGGSSLLIAIYIWLFVPESPVWLKAQENKRLGLKSQSSTEGKAVKWTELFKGGDAKVMWLAIAICGAALTAFMVMGTWLPTALAKERGFNMKEMANYLLWTNVFQLIAYPFAGIIGDKFGRKLLIASSSILTGACLYFWMNAPDKTVFFALGMAVQFAGALFWSNLGAFLAEQFATATRATALSFAFSTGRVISTVTPFLFGALAMKTGLAFVFTLTAACYLVTSGATLLLKETKGTVVVD